MHIVKATLKTTVLDGIEIMDAPVGKEYLVDLDSISEAQWENETHGHARRIRCIRDIDGGYLPLRDVGPARMSEKDDKERIVMVVAASTTDTRMPPNGQTALMDEHGVVEILPDNEAAEYWICNRADEPWTWRILPDQHVAQCFRCGTDIIYKVSERSPKNPAVKKVCRRCIERMLDDAE